MVKTRNNSKKVAVILFPGSNCELEAVRACKRSGFEADIVRWNDDCSKLKKYEAYIIPGGFSYEDRGRSGIIASKDPIVEILKEEAAQGKPLLGICNGAQILVETGLIPGLHIEKLEMALAPNERIQNGKILGAGYYNDWIYVKNSAKRGRSPFNNFDPKKILRVPIAHGEGRFTTKDPGVLKKIIAQDQTLFRYCTAQGKIVEDFPTNPNGAMYNLAGVCNPEGNILALMPHPERTPLGQPIFDSLAEFLKSGKKIHFNSRLQQKQKNIFKKIKPAPLENTASLKIKKISKKPDITILIRLMITDNEERTMETTLKRLGYNDVHLNRQIFLGFYLKSKTDKKKLTEALMKSGEIINPNKEIASIFMGNKTYALNKDKRLIETQHIKEKNFQFVVTENNNYSGKNLQSVLKNHLHEDFLKQVVRGIFWTIESKRKSTDIKEILGTHLFHNPHAMTIESF